MADWGLYSALRGTDNWAQRRQDKLMNMQIADQNAKEAEAHKQQAMAGEEKINEYFDAIANMDVLAEDQERITALEKSTRQGIVKGIARNNGDLSKFMSSGGISELHSYRNSILKSKEVKDAIHNKSTLQQIVEDKKNGKKFIFDVEVDVPMKNEKGDAILGKDGKPQFEKTSMSVDKQMAMFRAGEINKINYNGSEDEVKIDPFKYKSVFKDDNNKASKDNLVTANNIIFTAMNQGASRQQAEALAKDYVGRVADGGEPWRFKSWDPAEAALAAGKAGEALGKAGASSGKIPYGNQYKRGVEGTGQGFKESANAPEWRNSDGSLGSKGYFTFGVSADMLNVFASQVGLNFKDLNGKEVKNKDGDFIDAEDIDNPKLLANPTIYSPRTGEKIKLDGKKYSVTGVSPKIHRLDGKSYMQANIYTNEETLDDTGIRNTAGFDKITDAWKSLVEDVGGGGMAGDNYNVTAWIQVNDSPSAQHEGSQSLINSKTKSDMTMGIANQGTGEVSPAVGNFMQRKSY